MPDGFHLGFIEWRHNDVWQKAWTKIVEDFFTSHDYSHQTTKWCDHALTPSPLVSVGMLGFDSAGGEWGRFYRPKYEGFLQLLLKNHILATF